MSIVLICDAFQKLKQFLHKNSWNDRVVPFFSRWRIIATWKVQGWRFTKFRWSWAAWMWSCNTELVRTRILPTGLSLIFFTCQPVRSKLWAWSYMMLLFNAQHPETFQCKICLEPWFRMIQVVMPSYADAFKFGTANWSGAFNHLTCQAAVWRQSVLKVGTIHIEIQRSIQNRPPWTLQHVLQDHHLPAPTQLASAKEKKTRSGKSHWSL